MILQEHPQGGGDKNMIDHYDVIKANTHSICITSTFKNEWRFFHMPS